MSRHSNRKRTLNRANPLYLANGGGTMYVAPGQAQSVAGQVFYGGTTKNIATGQTALFNPGTPLAPITGVNPGGMPVQWRFPISANTFPVDRSLGLPDIPSFQQLRNLAKLYSGITLCERCWFDLVPRMKLKISLKAEYVAGGADDKDYQAEISYFKTWFESPDKMHDLHSWIRMALRDQVQIDELYIYKRKKRGGGLNSLEIVDGSCYTPDMEILTESGWKLFQDVNIGTDMFATRNPETKAFEWQKATYFHEADWDSDTMGDLYHFTSHALDLLVTPNHRMLISSLPRSLGGSRHRGRGEVILSAKELAEGMKNHTSTSGVSIPATSQWLAPDVPEIVLPTYSKRSRDAVFSGDDFAAFMGMYLAEGSTGSRDEVCISQRTKSKGYKPFQELLMRVCGKEPCYTGMLWTFKHKTLHEYLKALGLAHEKYVPDLILNMSRRQLTIFWHYYVLGDGSIDKQSGHETITTVSKEMADDLQEVVQKMGFAASVRVKYAKYDVPFGDIIVKKENIRPSYIIKKRTSSHSLFNIKRLPYNGKVYCVSVPNEVIYVRRNGRPAWCGNTIKPLLDDWGKPPQPPNYAYQQYPWGIPGAWFKANELIHYQETPSTDNPYGQSRVERIIMRVNQALRKQNKDLKYFTEGNIPQGMMMPPEAGNWTPDQIDAFEQSWNSLLAGNPTQQVRMRFTQPGMKYQAFEEYKLDSSFDMYIFKECCGAYGVSPGDVAFTEDIHKSSGDSQQNMLYRRTIDPLAITYASFFTQAINNDFDPDLHGEMFEASFTGFDEEEDVSALSAAYSALTGAGILGITNAGKLLKLPDDPNAPYIGRVIITATGPIFLDDMASDKMRNAQMQSQLAGFQQAATPAKPKPPTQQGNVPVDGEQDATEETPPTQSPATAQPKASPVTAKQRAIASDDNEDEDERQALEDEEDEEEEGILPDDEDEEEDDEPTPEEIMQEQEISFHLTADTAEPYSDLERYYAEAYIPEYTEEYPIERHVPGGHDHDQKTHGDFSHPAYGAKHDTTPANKTAMAATAKSTPKLAAAQAKVTSAIAAVKSAQTALHSAVKADKPAARATLKAAHATLKSARAAVHTLNEQARATRKQLAAEAHAAKVKAADEKKAAKAKETAQTKEVKAQTKEKAQDTAARVKATKAQAKAKAAKVAAQKKTEAAQAKAQAMKAHIQKLATAAKAKAASMLVKSQAKAQTSAVKAAKTQAKSGSTQAHAQLKTAKVQQVAAKKVQALTNTIGAKANLYNALSGRKISATWTAQDASDAASIASDLHSLLEAVNSHTDESNVTGLAKNLAQSISSLSARKGISQASASVLQKLSVSAQQQLSRSLLGVDLYDEYEVDDDEIEAEYEGEWFDDEDTNEPTEEERRYTIGELLELLQQQMQTQATDQNGRAHLERSEEDARGRESDYVTGGTTISNSSNDVTKDYRRWRDRAIDDVKAARVPRGFTTTLIPDTIHRWISNELAACSSVEDVRDVFAHARGLDGRGPAMSSKDDLAKSVHDVFAQVAQRGHKGIAALESE